MKIFMVKVYAGAELLSRIPIRFWNPKNDDSVDKDLLAAITQHVKEPF